ARRNDTCREPAGRRRGLSRRVAPRIRVPSLTPGVKGQRGQETKGRFALCPFTPLSLGPFGVIEMKFQGTVLIVDDEAYVRESLATVLQRAGYKVRTADGSQAALQPGILEGLDAVITDLRMPGDDGLRLLNALVEKEPGLPVIVLTGHGSVPSAVECMRAG